jgi:methionine-rich copper-binding protein CopC
MPRLPSSCVPPPARTCAALVLLLGAFWPAALSAHAILVRSEPQAGAVVATAAEYRCVLVYNSRIDRVRSLLSLSGPDGRDVRLALAEDAPANELRATMTLSPGAYRLHWQVLAADGHITRGDIRFTVVAKPS